MTTELIEQRISALTAKIPNGGWCDDDGCEGLTAEESAELEDLLELRRQANEKEQR